LVETAKFESLVGSKSRSEIHHVVSEAVSAAMAKLDLAEPEKDKAEDVNFVKGKKKRKRNQGNNPNRNLNPNYRGNNNNNNNSNFGRGFNKNNVRQNNNFQRGRGNYSFRGRGQGRGQAYGQQFQRPYQQYYQPARGYAPSQGSRPPFQTRFVNNMEDNSDSIRLQPVHPQSIEQLQGQGIQYYTIQNSPN